MRVYGLTGNIGSGKSTVARMLEARGVPVVDADRVARDVVEPGRPALREIAERFPGVLKPDGTLDRKALAARVFADSGERVALEHILHPRIGEEVAARMGALAGAGHPCAVYEAALIVENRLDEGLDGLIVVTAPQELAIERLRRRDGMSEEEARSRLSAQLPAEDKVSRARFVVENTGSEAELEAQVDPLAAALKAGA